MKDQVERVSKWCYQGLWGILTRWFRVPNHPPTLPTLEGELPDSFQPAEGFLRYLKFQFWVLFFVIDVAIFVVWLVITLVEPWIGVLLSPVALFLAIAPDVIAYLAIHLRYDTTWYVMTKRSLRIRRGIWIIHETTITFENVQNVTVNQGPLQRWFGIANVMIETAGGGGASQQHGQAAAWQTAHCGLIEGVADAQRIRDLLMSRLGQSRTAGLGDEAVVSASAWTSEHVAALRDIRDLLAANAN